jgi:ATP-binding cassette subfamily F protein 3
MVTVTDVSMAFAGRVLYEAVSLQINRGDRIALVGANGVGKSTLFSILLGDLTPDAGTVSRERGITFGFLPQETVPEGDETVLEIATTIRPDVKDRRRLTRAFERGDSHDESGYHRAMSDLAEWGVFRAEPEAKKILSGLAFRERDFGRPARELSGGWRMRAHLARLLVMAPDVLMLDEPTNHLDLESVIWFEEYLRGYRGAIFTISHDREFIDSVSDQIMEIRHRRLHRYRGTFDQFLAERAARDERHRAAYDNQKKQIRDIVDSANRFRAKARRASQAQSKLKEVDRMEKVAPPEEDAPVVRFRFPQPSRAGQHPVVLKGVHQAYGDHVVYGGIDFQCTRGEKVVLVGPNGAGKSTLLKILAGVVPIQAGERSLGNNARIGYYAQNRTEMLDPNKTVLSEALAASHPQPEELTRTILGCFLFRGDDVFKSVGILSGGEKSRLALAKQLLDPPNVLLMDEPTTHLDLASMEALIAALKQFEGTLIFISHDVYFIRSLAQRTVHISAGKLTPYAGGYDYYLEKSLAGEGRAGVIAGDRLPRLGDARAGGGTEPERRAEAGRSVFKTKEQKRQEAVERQARSEERKRLQARVESIGADLVAAEARQKEVAALLEDPETYKPGGDAIGLNRELTELAGRIERLEIAWEEAAENMAGAGQES